MMKLLQPAGWVQRDRKETWAVMGKVVGVQHSCRLGNCLLDEVANDFRNGEIFFIVD